MQKRHEEENARYKENMRKKMEMLLKLKGDITANRVLIYSIHQDNILKLHVHVAPNFECLLFLLTGESESPTCQRPGCQQRGQTERGGRTAENSPRGR